VLFSGVRESLVGLMLSASLTALQLVVWAMAQRRVDQRARARG
jgi:hypothetical protein